VERDLTELEIQNVARAAGEVTLKECVTTANKQGATEERMHSLCNLLNSIARDAGYNGKELTGACAYLCINQLLIPHGPEEDSPKGFFNA
jgi:hypothetical protein